MTLSSIMCILIYDSAFTLPYGMSVCGMAGCWKSSTDVKCCVGSIIYATIY